MATASQIVAGRAAVVLSVDDSALGMGLKLASSRLREWGTSVASSMGGLSKAWRGGFAGASAAADRLTSMFGKAGDALKSGGTGLLTGAGAGSLPLLGGLKAFAEVETELAKLRTAANPTAEEFKKLQAYIEQIGSTPGIGQANLAAAMTELVKAGMPLKQAMDGAGLAAVKFAKVAEVSVTDAAIVATDMSNVFGENVTTAMDILSQAADSSSVSLREVTLSMSMASAVAGMTGKGLRETATAIGIMGTDGLKGSDAGTALKTMLLRLAAPVDEGAKAMAEFGLSFRDASGNLKPMTGIISELQSKLGGLGSQAKDDALRRIFGTDAIRPAAILLSKGTKGWSEFSDRMAEGLSIGEKWSILMDTMSGAFEKATTVVVNAAVAIGKVLAPSLKKVGDVFMASGQLLTYWIGQNNESIVTYGKVVLAVGAVGATLWTVGSALKFAALGFSGLKIALSAFGGTLGLIRNLGTIAIGVLGGLLSPIGLLGAAVAGLVGYAAYASGAFQGLADTAGATWADIGQTASQTLQGIKEAIASGDMEAASRVAWAGLKTIWRQGYNWLHAGWLEFTSFFKRVWTTSVYAVSNVATKAWARLQETWIEVSGFFLDVWGMTVNGVKGLWRSAQNWISDGLLKAGRLVGAISEETATEAMRILDEADSKAEENDKLAMARALRERDQRLKAIADEEQSSLSSLRQMENAEQLAISKKHKDALEADRKELVEAKKNLSAITERTKLAAEEKRRKEAEESERQRQDSKKKDIEAIGDIQDATKAASGIQSSTVGGFYAALLPMIAQSIGGAARQLASAVRRAVTQNAPGGQPVAQPGQPVRAAQQQRGAAARQNAAMQNAQRNAFRGIARWRQEPQRFGNAMRFDPVTRRMVPDALLPDRENQPTRFDPVTGQMVPAADFTPAANRPMRYNPETQRMEPSGSFTREQRRQTRFDPATGEMFEIGEGAFRDVPRPMNAAQIESNRMRAEQRQAVEDERRARRLAAIGAAPAAVNRVNQAAIAAPAAAAAIAQAGQPAALQAGRDQTSQGILNAATRSADLLGQILDTLRARQGAAFR